MRRQTQDFPLKTAFESKADRDEIQCRRLARAGSNRWGQRGPRLVCHYLQSMAKETSQHRTSQTQKDGGVDDALSQGRQCLLDSKAFPFVSLLSLSLSHLPGKLNPGHYICLYSESLGRNTQYVLCADSNYYSCSSMAIMRSKYYY